MKFARRSCLTLRPLSNRLDQLSELCMAFPRDLKQLGPHNCPRFILTAHPTTDRFAIDGKPVSKFRLPVAPKERRPNRLDQLRRSHCLEPNFSDMEVSGRRAVRLYCYVSIW